MGRRHGGLCGEMRYKGDGGGKRGLTGLVDCVVFVTATPAEFGIALVSGWLPRWRTNPNCFR
jgi:hypothetical protein